MHVGGSPERSAEAPSPRVVGMAAGVTIGLVVTVVTSQWWWVGSFLVAGGIVGSLRGRSRSD